MIELEVRSNAELHDNELLFFVALSMLVCYGRVSVEVTGLPV